MGQIGPPKIVFYESDLAKLEWVFQSVCSTRGFTDEHAKPWPFADGCLCWLATG
jgi:hypothetical protein